MDVFVFAIGVTLVLFLVCLIGEWGHERAKRKNEKYSNEPLDAIIQRRMEEKNKQDLKNK